MVFQRAMYVCESGFILFDGISEKPCAEHHESNNRICVVKTGVNYYSIFNYVYRDTINIHWPPTEKRDLMTNSENLKIMYILKILSV